MDIHQQLLGVAGTMRAGAEHSSALPPPIGARVERELTVLADRIDPNVYSPASTDIDSTTTAIRTAIADLEVIPANIKPTSVDPMRDQLTMLLSSVERHPHS